MDPQKLWSEYAERIREAKETEKANRAEAWLGVPVKLFGYPVAPLTLHKLLLLEQVQHPLIHGEEMEEADLRLFLWIVSPEFKLDEAAAAAFQKRCKLGQSVVDTGADQLQEYLDSQFDFATGGQGGDDGDHYISTVIDLLAHEYSWPAQTILHLPLPQIHQLVASISKRYGAASGKAVPTFNKRADQLKAEYLRQVKNMRN